MPRGFSRYDDARLQGRLWVPPPDPRPVMWYDAAEPGSFTTASGVVSQWNDRSGNARHATQGTAGLRPTWLPTAWTGSRPAMYFGGSAHNAMATAALSGLGLTAAEIFVVQKNDLDPTTGDANTAALTAVGNSGQADHMPWTDGNTYLGWLSSTRRSLGNLTPDFSQPHIVNVRSASADWELIIDGASIFSTGTNTFGISTPIIGSSGALAYYKGLIAEIIIFGRLLSTMERARVSGYLAWKWGLVSSMAANHPYKRWPPLVGDAALRERYLYTEATPPGPVVSYPSALLIPGF